MARLILVGLPGVGKSSVAAAIGEKWGYDVVDLDELISAAVAMPAPQYLREFGETHFREREFDALCVAVDSNAIVATGAGVVTREPARAVLTRERSVWLDADDTTLVARTAGGERPLLGEDRAGALVRLRLERDAWYKECSLTRVDASGSLDDVVERVMEIAQRART